MLGGGGYLALGLDGGGGRGGEVRWKWGVHSGDLTFAD